MANKQFLVVGLGQYGFSVAQALAEMGCEVIAMDRSEELVQNISPYVTYALAGDVADEEMLRNLGVGNLDGAVVAISTNMESSILATLTLKDLGVPNVLVKASSELHKKILLKIGADSVIFPEKEMGIRTAKNLTARNFIDLVELSPDFSIIEVPVGREWRGRSIIDIDFRRKYKINIIAIKEDEDITVNPDPYEPLREGQYLVVIGDNKSLKKLTS